MFKIIGGTVVYAFALFGLFKFMENRRDHKRMPTTRDGDD